MPLEKLVFAPLARGRLVAAMVAVFGLFAVAIAIVGVYGAMACAANGRLHEVGVRLALGATPWQIRYALIGQGLQAVALGIVVGIPIALAATSALASQLVAVRQSGWMNGFVVSLVVFLCAVIACIPPAFWVTRVAPMRALKRE
jgi:putative ABC transport system permease protein